MITWKRFKELVDEKLKDANLSEDIIIWYIELDNPTEEDFKKEPFFEDTIQFLNSKEIYIKN